MSTAVAKPTLKSFFAQDVVKAKFTELLGKRANQFVTSVLQIANSNQLLAVADPMSLFNAAVTAAAMDLPINPNLGFAYIVPYKDNSQTGGGVVFAQFQVGWKGFVQLAQRTNLFKTINAVEVHENQLEDSDYITGEIKIKKMKPGELLGPVVGYVAYFKLLSGFEKMLYMTRGEMEAHAKKYSKTFAKKKGVWADGEDGFNAMAKKTVLKLLLSKYAPLSIDMQIHNAVIVDQAVIDPENNLRYVDNENEDAQRNKENERVMLLIDAATTIDALEKHLPLCTNPELEGYYMDKKITLTNDK